MKKAGYYFLVLLTLVGTILLAPATASAKISDSQLDMFAENNIYFYDPNGNSTGSKRNCSSLSVSGGTVEEKVWNGLTTFLTPEQAAGVMGNMQSESHFNPAQHEVGQMNSHQPGFALDDNPKVSYGLGLIQWSFQRRINLYNYVKERDESLIHYFDEYSTYSPTYEDGDFFLRLAGDDDTNRLVELELEFLKGEIMASYSGLLSTTTVEEASNYFLLDVEKPQDMQSKKQQRYNQSQAFYDQFYGTSGGSGGECGDLEEYVRLYVWEQYHSASEENYTIRKDGYAAAVQERQSQGKYVGGSVDGVAGIDCGGFVTTIMQDSGFDPEYNGCGSNTAPQEYWLREGGGSDSWEWLNPGEESMDASNLMLGDVAFTGEYTGGCIVGGGHTYMFIGNIEGYETNIASASYTSGKTGGRAPMSGHEAVSGTNIRWYRKVK